MTTRRNLRDLPLQHAARSVPRPRGGARAPRGDRGREAAAGAPRPSTGLDRAAVLTTTILAAIAWGRVHQLFGPTSTLPVGKIFIPLTVLLLLVCPDVGSRFKQLLRTPQGKALFVFVGTICVSVPFGLYASASLSGLRNFLQTAAILVLAIGLTVRTRNDLLTVVNGVVISVALLGAMTAKAAILGGFEGRYGASASYDPNDAAFACVVALPLALWLLVSGTRSWHRLVGLAGIAGAMGGVIFSGSRGGFLGLAAVLFGILLIRGRRALPVKWRMGFLVLVIVGLAQAPSSFWTRVSTLTDLSGDYNMRSTTGRKQVWTRGIRYAIQRPLWGVGFRGFGQAEGRWAGVNVRPGVGFKWSTAHNSVIQVAAELGFLGLLAWLGLYVPTWLITRRFERDRQRARDPTLEAWGKAVGVALVGFFVAGFFLSAAYGGVAVTLAGLGIATTILMSQSLGEAVDASVPASHARPRRPRLLSASVTAWPAGQSARLNRIEPDAGAAR